MKLGRESCAKETTPQPGNNKRQPNDTEADPPSADRGRPRQGTAERCTGLQRSLAHPTFARHSTPPNCETFAEQTTTLARLCSAGGLRGVCAISQSEISVLPAVGLQLATAGPPPRTQRTLGFEGLAFAGCTLKAHAVTLDSGRVDPWEHGRLPPRKDTM